MTTVVPEFLFAVLEQELQKIQLQVLKKVAAEYNLDEEELIARVLPSKPTYVVPERIQIIRKRAPKTVTEEDLEKRCKARIWNRGRGGQCSRKHVHGDLCTQHHKEQQNRGNLKYGWIHEPPSPALFGNGQRPKALHITVI